MSSINVNDPSKYIDFGKKGLAIVESANPNNGVPTFYQVPGKTLGDVMAMLKIKKMTGRVIAFNQNAEFAGTAIRDLGPVIHEAELIKEGFETLSNVINIRNLKFVPAVRPIPQINFKEADRILLAAKDPVYIYNYSINSGEWVKSINSEQLRELFKDLGYEINEEIEQIIFSGQLDDVELSSGYRLSPKQAEFIQLFANIDANITAGSKHGVFINNFRQIQVFDEFNKSNKVEQISEELEVNAPKI